MSWKDKTKDELLADILEKQLIKGNVKKEDVKDKTKLKGVK